MTPDRVVPWQLQLADALGCFWNAAICSDPVRHDSTAGCAVAGVAVGLEAVATRLREYAHTTPADSAPLVEASVKWAVDRWFAEVSERPLVNVHRRALDDTWRQVIRHFGGDDVVLCGPRHDELAAYDASHEGKA